MLKFTEYIEYFINIPRISVSYYLLMKTCSHILVFYLYNGLSKFIFQDDRNSQEFDNLI